MAIQPVAPAAISAYRAAGAGAVGAGVADATGATAPQAVGPSFGDVLQRAVETTVQQSRAADTASTQALAGEGGVTDVVLAVTKAELALQTAVALRDRVVAAYQEVMRMPI